MRLRLENLAAEKERRVSCPVEPEIVLETGKSV